MMLLVCNRSYRHPPWIIHGQRFFAKKSRRTSPPNRKTVSKKHRAWAKQQGVLDTVSTPADNVHQQVETEVFVPPSFLLPTASPYVFCAKHSAQQAGLDPTTELFTEFAVSVQEKFKPHMHRPQTHFHSVPKEPDDTLPRIAFLGRSNVGKSSLINALLKTKLAVTSKQPGRTQNIYYYAWNTRNGDERLGYLVDLPGYGYAVGPEKAVEQWQRRTQQFLLRNTIRRLYLLQDARVGATSFDHTVQGWMEEAQIPYTVVLTKLDGVRRPAEVIKHVNNAFMKYTHQANDSVQSPLVHVTSAKTGAGLAELWSSIEADAYAIMEEDEEEL